MGKSFSFIVIMVIIVATALGGCGTKEDMNSKTMPSNHSDTYEYNIAQLYSSGLPNEGGIGEVRQNAFNELFKAGKNAIPTLLKYCLDTRVVEFIIMHPNSSYIPMGEERNLRIGIICLYLVEAIKTQEQYHSTPLIYYSEQWQGNGNADQIQNRAYTAYLKWWESVKDKELTKNYTRIVPWVGYLGYVIRAEDINDNIDFGTETDH